MSAEALARLAGRMREGGLRWLSRRIAAEAVLPSTRPGRTLHAFIRALVAWRRRLGRGDVWSDAGETLYAFYDAKVEPITFDVAWFIAGAELERRRLGLPSVHFVLVPGPHEGVREEEPAYEQVVDSAARRWRLTHMTFPAFQLLPATAGATFANSRRHARELRARAVHVYPRGYEASFPVPHRSAEIVDAARTLGSPAVLRADETSRAHVARWIAERAGSRAVVTITIRGYGYHPERNSDVDAWTAFAAELDRRGFLPVFVLDTETVFQAGQTLLDRFEVFREAAWNVGLRLALYEASYLCLGVNNGPMALAWLSPDARYLTFKMMTASVPQSAEPFLRSRGFTPGKSLPFATPFQRWIWEDDRLDVIRREFDRMVGTIEAGQGSSAAPINFEAQRERMSNT